MPAHPKSSTITGLTSQTFTTSPKWTGLKWNLWTFLWAAGHANRSALQANRKGQPMKGRSGRMSPKLFAHYDPDGLCWKTLQPSLPLANSDEPSVTWPRSGMWDSGAAYELPTSVPPTEEPESSSLLSAPTARDGQGAGGVNKTGGLNLPEQIDLLPTPDAYQGTRGGSQHPDKRQAGGHMVSLQDVAEHQLLPTPGVAGGGKKIPEDATWSGKAAYKADGTKVQVHLDRIDMLLPTPTATPYGNNQSASPAAGIAENQPNLELTATTAEHVSLLPTPRATRGGSATETIALLPTPMAYVRGDDTIWEATSEDQLHKAPNDGGTPWLESAAMWIHRLSNGDNMSPPSDDGNLFSDD